MMTFKHFNKSVNHSLLRSGAYQAGGVGVTLPLLHALSQGRQEKGGQIIGGLDWLGGPQILVKRLVMSETVKTVGGL